MKPTLARERAAIAIATLFAVASLWPAFALAFGSVHAMGQDAEHERITRQALACPSGQTTDACFQPSTLDSLTGARGTFGAVGAPDRGELTLISAAHCSAADYLDVPGYPQSRTTAQRILTECRDHMLVHLSHAVADAAALLDQAGRLRASQIPSLIPCIYSGSANGPHGRAKCNVLTHLGIILHAAQDFYSHTNWVDVPDPTRPIGPENPPGLGQEGPAPWLDLRVDNPPFPLGLISGCFDDNSFLGEERGCIYGELGEHRIRHLDLNKDTGPIDPVIGVGTTRRGAVGDNFRRAVEAAIDDTRDQWALLRERLIETYGPEDGAMMICALTRDDPIEHCR